MRLSQLLLAGLHITEKVDGQPGTLPTATALDTSPICQDSWGLLGPLPGPAWLLTYTTLAVERHRGTPASTGVLARHTAEKPQAGPESYIIPIGQWHLG